MEELDKRESYFKKAKFWNMFLLVIKIIGSLAGMFTLPSAINPAKQIELLKQSMTMVDDQKFTATIQKSIDLAVNPLYRLYIVATFIISIALVVFFFLANKKLANQAVQTKIPYYVYLGVIVIGLMISLLTGGIGFSNGMAIFTTIFSIVWQVLLAIPAILVLVNLFKLDAN